ncbi:TetR/AcrR family transcriptional regulator [Gordonia sp. VNK21]|uniref:TetR/AcrR family transcriptional regulator n=1 Tax=Gordonia sp. VNK21 TaxID=3382483 RepID=UPI0038D3AB6D
MPESTRPARPRAEHLGPARRRPQILDTALQIACDEGISAVTVAAVAARLEVTRPVVYSCFPGRTEILSALIDREEMYLGQAMAEILQKRRVNADEDVFIEGFQVLLAAAAHRPESWKLLYGDPDTEVIDLFGRGRAMIVDRCATLLRPTLEVWGTDHPDVKLPILVDLWVSAGESAVRTLLGLDGVPRTQLDPEELGRLVGAAVYRALRDA